jgi:two-component system nitrate/nitrite response regulator NarL
MNAVAVNPVAQALRVLIAGADPQRAVALAQGLRALGHFVVGTGGEASVVLADGVVPPGNLPVVSLGAQNMTSEGRLPSDATFAQIDAALRAVAVGLQVEVADTRRSFEALDESEQPILLTPRETEVLRAVSEGLSNKEIARELGISLHTVKFHLESLMHKLDASSRTEAVIRAMRLQLLEPFRV